MHLTEAAGKVAEQAYKEQAAKEQATKGKTDKPKNKKSMQILRK